MGTRRRAREHEGAETPGRGHRPRWRGSLARWLTAWRSRALVSGGVVAVMLSGQAQAGPSPTVPVSTPPTAVLEWQQVMPGVTIRESSPVVARLASRSVVVGAHDGKVYAFDLLNGDPEPGWPVQTANPVNSSAAAVDLTGDGHDDVFIGSGTADHGQCSGGGVYAISPTGNVRWKYQGSDPTCPNLAFHSSPTIGDITGGGSPTAVIGALGLQSPALNAVTGKMNVGWPFYTDDTVFSTPALANLDHSGVPAIVVGGDSSPGPGPMDWRGGMVRAVRGDGHLLWQFLTDEIVRSSPAIGDLDGSGHQTIVFGTGNYWVGHGGSHDSTKVFALNEDGHLRWSRDLGGLTLASPALADVTGSGHPDVVIGTADGPNGGKVWVLDANGNPVPGWDGRPSLGGVVIGGITTADLNGDGTQDVLVPTGRGVFVFDGKNGTLLFNLAVDLAGFQNSPLVTDDGGGAIGITIAGTANNGTAYVQHYRVYPLGQAKLGAYAWPQFHHDGRHTGNLEPPALLARSCAGRGIDGYWLAAKDGGVFGFCGARFEGSASGTPLQSPIVAMASTPSGLGYWLVSGDGGVYAYGDAPYLGSLAAQKLTKPIVAIARTQSGKGYWLASADGGVFAFGDAPYYGSAGSVNLPVKIVSMLSTPTGKGYWLVGDEGTVMTYGDARFFGSPNGHPLTAPIVAAARTPTGLGYWLVGADGGVFTYGNASYWGSAGNRPLNQPIVGIVPTAAGRGYWLVAADGGVFAFGDAPYVGSVTTNPLNAPVAAAATPGG